MEANHDGVRVDTGYVSRLECRSEGSTGNYLVLVPVTDRVVFLCLMRVDTGVLVLYNWTWYSNCTWYYRYLVVVVRGTCAIKRMDPMVRNSTCILDPLWVLVSS